MILTVFLTGVALAAALFMPIRWGVWGYIGVAALLFLLSTGYYTVTGFEGTSLEESLLLFNGSWAAFIGFNLQITYRAFALPLIALAVPFVARLARAR